MKKKIRNQFTYDNNYQNNVALKEYADAMWDFMTEHCDIPKTGTMFVKFHTNGRTDFEKRVIARLNGYHREDVEAKKVKQLSTKETHEAIKKMKKERYQANKKKGKRILMFRKFINKITFNKYGNKKEK